MTDLVSIIVPVYKAEKYLEECIRSIVDQTYKNLDIILVDDGSPDCCPRICDEWKEKDDRIRVFHKENGGQSSARNVGVEAALGEYISFCDADDLMKPSMIEKLLYEIKKQDAEIAICGIERFPNGEKVIPFQAGKVFSPRLYIEQCKKIHSRNEFCFAVRCLFEKKYIIATENKFDEKVQIGEDFLYCMNAIMGASKVATLTDCLYLYRNNPDSLMNVKYKATLYNDYEVQYEKKISLTRKYGLQNNHAWMDDLSYYYITRFQGILLSNAMNAPEEKRLKQIQEILALPMLVDNYRIKIMWKCGVKHFLFCMMCKLRLSRLVMFVMNRRL